MYHEERMLAALGGIRKNLDDGKDPYPLVVEFYPTNLCNLSCTFCFGARLVSLVEKKTETKKFW